MNAQHPKDVHALTITGQVYKTLTKFPAMYSMVVLDSHRYENLQVGYLAAEVHPWTILLCTVFLRIGRLSLLYTSNNLVAIPMKLFSVACFQDEGCCNVY